MSFTDLTPAQDWYFTHPSSNGEPDVLQRVAMFAQRDDGVIVGLVAVKERGDHCARFVEPQMGLGGRYIYRPRNSG